METRRRFMQFILSGGAMAAMPKAVARAAAIAPDPGSSFLDAEHVVILMQENRSFDHVFGTLQGVRGFHDSRAAITGNGNSVFLQSDKKGNTFAPWRLDINETKITWMGSIPHSRDSQVDAWNNGQHDNWIDAKRSYHHDYAKIPITMGHYTRKDLPFYYDLADAFTVCDQNYCGAMTSTTPNRLIFWTGTVRNQPNLESNVYMRNPEILEGGMTWTTFPERLEKYGISWKFYQNELTQRGGMTREERSWLSNFGCNVLECFDKFQVGADPGFLVWIDERIAECSSHLEKLYSLEMLSSEKKQEQITEASALLAFLKKRKETFPKKFDALTKEEKELFNRAFVTNKNEADYRKLDTLHFTQGDTSSEMKVPEGDILYQFRKDVQSGQLPTVSWLAAPEHFSDHPTSAWFGAYYVSEVMNILTENPDIWKKTIFILTYDENDGYFDHCPSFVAPDPHRPETGRVSSGITDAALEYTYREDEIRMGVSDRLARSGPIGLGFRVPMVVASPWSRGGWVNSQLFDHSSTLQFLEKFIDGKFGTKVEETNISSWRRSISGDLTSCFRVFDPTEPNVSYLDRDQFLVKIQKAKNMPLPTGFDNLSKNKIEYFQKNPAELQAHLWQEAGQRKACALPYELSCELLSDPHSLMVRLEAGNTLHGNRSSGAPFNIYTRNLASGEKMQVGTYSVAAGDDLTAVFHRSEFSDGRYDVRVQAPNGFFRHFSGDARTENLHVSSKVRIDSSGHVFLDISAENNGNASVMFQCEVQPKGRIEDIAVEAGKKRNIVIPLDQDHMWYDVKITEQAAGTHGLWHYAGRVETGKSTMTDPQIGNL